MNNHSIYLYVFYENIYLRTRVFLILQVFFPIYANAHYYLLVMNLRNRKMEIIDNRYNRTRTPTRSKYGNMPEAMLLIFQRLMDELYPASHDIVHALETTIIAMPWRDSNNSNDCALYCMKHMETYLGQDVKQWDIGFKKKDFEPLKKLRVEYCSIILTDQSNILRNDVIEKATEWAKHMNI